MTTVEAPIATETPAGRQPTTPVSLNRSGYTQCASYKEAKVLAGSRRREGTHAYAVYLVALDCWCVR